MQNAKSVMWLRACVVFGALIVFPALASGAVRIGLDSAHERQRPLGERSTWDSVYTVEQAARGEKIYGETCARCHRATLGGGDEAPALTGSGFMSSWSGQMLQELHERVRTTMPTDTPAVYSRQQVTDVIAYMLRFNGFPPGAAELTHADDALKTIRFLDAKP
jgi:cytochrome c5